MRLGFPSAGYHTQLPYPEILRDMMHVGFRTHLCRDLNRQFGQRSNTTVASVTYAPQALGGPVAQEDLAFHPALAYKYSGERAACKVVIPSEPNQNRRIPWHSRNGM